MEKGKLQKGTKIKLDGIDFTIITKIGNGTYSIVYEVSDESGNRFALKEIPNKDTGIDCIIEADIFSRLDHPFINRAFNVQTSKNFLYIVQPLANGTLSDLLETERFEYTQLVYHAYCLIQALTCLQRHNICNGDIKPQNILVFKDCLKISDFTLGRFMQEEETSKDICCTPIYRPLEVFRGMSWDKSVDVFSLGTTLYEMKYGKHLFPYQEDSKSERFIACLEDFGERYKIHEPVFSDETKSFTFKKSEDLNTSDPFDNLILRMVQIYPKRRAKPQELLEDPIFDIITKPISVYKINYKNCFTNFDPDILSQMIRKDFDRKVTFLACTLYKRLGKLINDISLLVCVCFYISSKIFNKNINIDYFLKDKVDMLLVERLILDQIKYNVYMKNPYIDCIGIRKNKPNEECTNENCNCRLRIGNFDMKDLDYQVLMKFNN